MSIQTLKKLGMVAGILVITWLLYLYRQVPHAQAPFATVIDQATEIRMSQASHKVVFSKEAGHWKVSDGTGGVFHPVDEMLIGQLISGLKSLQLEEEISDRADRAAEYEVSAENGLSISLSGSKESNKSVSGLFGKQAPDMAHLYFRFPDRPMVYLARGMLRGDLGRPEVNAWRSRQLSDIPEAKIQHILIEGHGFKTDLIRASTDSWTLNGGPVDVGFVNALIGTYAHAHVDDFVDPAQYPNLSVAEHPYAHVSIQATDKSLDLRIGAQNPQSKRYPASVGNDLGLVWLSQATLDSLLKKPPDLKTK